MNNEKCVDTTVLLYISSLRLSFIYSGTHLLGITLARTDLLYVAFPRLTISSSNGNQPFENQKARAKLYGLEDAYTLPSI
jgi:hypothetical protein